MSNQAAVGGMARINAMIAEVDDSVELKSTWNQMIHEYGYTEPETQLSLLGFYFQERAPFFQLLVAFEESGKHVEPETIVAVRFYRLMNEVLGSLTDADRIEITAIAQTEVSIKENKNV